jgi:small GTP-binding protein
MAQNSEDSNSIRCKTIIVGNSGVGKTSIIQRYLGKFEQDERSTVGASFTNKSENINGKTNLFEIWDTAGQERFRSINSIFYQDASVCILTYDITQKKSFEDLKNYWHNAVLEQSSQNIIFHVVGNKIDLFNKEEVDKNEVDQYCEKIGAEVSLISAKDENNAYVDMLFQKLGEKYLNSDIYRENQNNLSMTRTAKLSFDYMGENRKNEKKEKSDKKKCC